MDWVHNSLSRRALIVSSVVVIALAHWVERSPDKEFHNLLYHLTVIPILIAGMLFGWRMALFTAAFTMLCEFPLLWNLWPRDPVYRRDQIAEIAIFGLTGMVVGILSSRGRRQTAELERTARELEQAHTTLQKNFERLTKAERMYAVAQLSASLAHEIRNPLASIAGAAGILKRGQASRENVDDCLEIIHKESQRLNKLLANFLEFARPRAPRFQPADLSAVVDSVVAVARHAPDAARIDFRRSVDPSLPEVECDSEQVKQVLLNLVMNAVHATGEGTVELSAYTHDGNVVLAVRDEGSGIPEDQQEKIFDPFFTTKQDGSGLGLAIAAKIVQQHGGVLKAENMRDKGLKMMLELPLYRRSANGA